LPAVPASRASACFSFAAASSEIVAPLPAPSSSLSGLDARSGRWTRAHAVSLVAALLGADRRDLAAALCEQLGTTLERLAQRARAELARRETS